VETFEGRVHRAGRDVSLETALDFVQDRAPVGIFAQLDQRDEHGLFELTDDLHGLMPTL